MKPQDGGSGPIRSIWMTLKRALGFGNDVSGQMCVFEFWHAGTVHMNESTDGHLS